MKKNKPTFYRIVAVVDIKGQINGFVRGIVKKGTELYPSQVYSDSELNSLKSNPLPFQFGYNYMELTTDQFMVEIVH